MHTPSCLFMDSLVYKGHKNQNSYHTEEALRNNLQNRLSSALFQTGTWTSDVCYSIIYSRLSTLNPNSDW